MTDIIAWVMAHPDVQLTLQHAENTEEFLSVRMNDRHNCYNRVNINLQQIKLVADTYRGRIIKDYLDRAYEDLLSTRFEAYKKWLSDKEVIMEGLNEQ